MNKENVEKVLEEHIRPKLLMDGGSVEVVDIDEENGVVSLRLVGACATCPMAAMTLKNFVELKLKEYIPDLKRVEAV